MITPRIRLNRAQRDATFERQHGICDICKLPIWPKSFHVDHIVPRGLGGSNQPDNLRALHRRCHDTKTPSDIAAIAKTKRRAAVHAMHLEAMRTGTRRPNAKALLRARVDERRREGLVAERQD